MTLSLLDTLIVLVTYLLTLARENSDKVQSSEHAVSTVMSASDAKKLLLLLLPRCCQPSMTADCMPQK